MMTGKQLSLNTVSNGVVPRVSRGERPAIVALLARLLAPENHVRARLQQAQASLEEAVAGPERPAPTRPDLST